MSLTDGHPFILPDTPHAIALGSGGYFDYADPQADQVTIVDIAHGLAHTCRFGGHADEFVSVAEHSVLAHDLLARTCDDDLLLRAALLHDASEAYVGDVPKPMKPILGAQFADLTDAVDCIIAGKYLGGEVDAGLFHCSIVKAADTRAMILEGARYMSSPLWDWAREDDRGLIPGDLADWNGALDPVKARELFLRRARGLGIDE